MIVVPADKFGLARERGRAAMRVRLIKLDDPRTAAGLLRGLMIMDPQRAAMLGQRSAPGPDEIAQRTKICARLFLDGSRA